MALVEVSALIEASPADVWKDISQLGSHQEWMSDAESIAFVGDTTSGIGTIMEVVTKVGPFRTTDVMEFIAWDPPKTMAVLHRGSFEGTGTFSL
ncbi:MAG: SRPBCC family protein, partial [Acidimicrobiia bacterium]|nr:SRPBCC family protein [Acidimicrobiia bacterium]